MPRRLLRKNWLVIRNDHHNVTTQIVRYCWTRWGANDLAWRLSLAWGKTAPDAQLTRYSWTVHPYGAPAHGYAQDEPTPRHRLDP